MCSVFKAPRELRPTSRLRLQASRIENANQRAWNRIRLLTRKFNGILPVSLGLRLRRAPRFHNFGKSPFYILRSHSCNIFDFPFKDKTTVLDLPPSASVLLFACRSLWVQFLVSHYAAWKPLVVRKYLILGNRLLSSINEQLDSETFSANSFLSRKWMECRHLGYEVGKNKCVEIFTVLVEHCGFLIPEENQK